ncbi:Lcl C-terminal domain-containing protein [Poseidonibacter ostreae]|uniref:DUF1566 domain-containing protein n=1 Tax=Poseidonibacter ostreae TaxID=2654171 RepID=A0A6L4WNR4_9BACT|nr:DUF1566 domain-containing protein [Poseidonibacter ostreae]KAB7885219.1 DUF1566 domain-containing protein [Poseidonibacter ostreae]KAB7886567.1 DUF1566 domain-containing protein [Poseidonibacter ostreae]KAB7892432.1 DUF1566 domain-containing protein [Poseidonibacter ostreae]
MKYLVLILVFVSLLDAQIYRKKSQIVVDTKEKLMWVDDISVVKILKTHEEAIPYCEALEFAGYSDWRIPKIEEFKTIVDKKNFKNYINRAFKYNVPDGYWAERSHWRTLWFYADYMHFVSGTEYFDSRHKNKYVRCVRDI